jgi:hypothetical protein
MEVRDVVWETGATSADAHVAVAASKRAVRAILHVDLGLDPDALARLFYYCRLEEPAGSTVDGGQT